MSNQLDLFASPEKKENSLDRAIRAVKLNPMPGSQQDRPTTDFEPVSRLLTRISTASSTANHGLMWTKGGTHFSNYPGLQ